MTTATPTPTNPPISFGVRINFQPLPPPEGVCEVPDGYIEDHGGGFGDNYGYQYGWR